MDNLNSQTLRQQAQLALRRGREPKKLSYAFAGISMAISFVVFFVDFWLAEQISANGGLSNMGTRAIFSTARQALPLLSGFVSMCLELGFLAGLMRISRGQYADHTDLKTGFRKFWPLVRLGLIQSALYMAIAFLALQLGSLIFMFTPWAEPVMDVIYPLAASGAATVDDAALAQISGLMAPMFLIMGIVFLIVLMPFLFRMRMALYCLLDDPRGRAMAAIRESNLMMRRRFGRMIKIDLSLWYYYAAMTGMYLILWGDVILALFGIYLPVDAQILSMALYLITGLIQFGIQAYIRPGAEITYITAYDQLREKPKDEGVVLGNIFDM